MNPVTGLRSLTARPPSQPHPPQASRPPPSWARNRTPGTSRLERLKPCYAQRFGWSKDEERQWHCRQRQKRWRQRRGRDGEPPPEPLGPVQSEASLASVGSSVASTASAANSERLRWCAPGRWVQEPADEGAIIASARRSGLAPTVVAACRAPRVTASSLHLDKTGRKGDESPTSAAVAGALKEAVPRMRDGLDQDSGAWSAYIPSVFAPLSLLIAVRCRPCRWEETGGSTGGSTHRPVAAERSKEQEEVFTSWPYAPSTDWRVGAGGVGLDFAGGSPRAKAGYGVPGLPPIALGRRAVVRTPKRPSEPLKRPSERLLRGRRSKV